MWWIFKETFNFSQDIKPLNEPKYHKNFYKLAAKIKIAFSIDKELRCRK